jgi:hypothetical protein
LGSLPLHVIAEPASRSTPNRESKVLRVIHRP